MKGGNGAMAKIPEVAIEKSVLLWALERSGRAFKIEQRFPKLSEWLKGESMPTLRQLEDLAKATYTPLGYFFLPEPPVEQLPIPYFRTDKNQFMHQFSAELIETVQIMKRRQNWMRDYLIEQGHDPLPFVNSVDLAEDPSYVAQKMRKTLGLEEEWAAKQPNWTEALRELQIRMENIGIIVVVNSVVGNNTHRKLNPSEFRGFVLVDEYAPLVFVNGADGKAAQMFTLAHELAHVWFGVSAAFDLRDLQPAEDKIELICNMLAAEFLVPKHEFQEIWSTVSNNSEPFQILARQFKVSELVVARRALDLGYITKDTFIKFYNDYQTKEKNKNQNNDGGNFYASQNLRIGRRFAEAIITAVREEKLLYHEAYQLTGLYGKTFERYAESLELGNLL